MRRTLVGFALIAALAVGGFAGVSISDQGTAKADLGPLERMQVPAAAFHPRADGLDWYNNGIALRGSGTYLAELSFPHEAVRIRRITIHYYDIVAGNLCVSYWRSQPSAGTATNEGGTCSEGGTPGVHKASFRPSSLNVTEWHGAYLQLHFEENTRDLKLHGVTVEYYELL